MTFPPLEIYQFEDQLEPAVYAWLKANGINDVNKQREWKIKLEDGTIQVLRTPRVEVKFLNGGFAANEHYANNAAGRWLDITTGTLYLKIVTRRKVAEESHGKLRSLCRFLMQYTQIPGISQFLQYHIVEKMLEAQSTVTLEADKLHDVSALTFNTWLRIKPEKFPITP